MRAVAKTLCPSARLKIVTEAATAAVTKYCREDGIPRAAYASTVNWLKTLDVNQTSGVDWFLLMDALAMRCPIFENNEDVQQLYHLAFSSWFFNALSTRREKISAN